MLVLSRRKDTSIMVGEDVEIKVLDIQGNKVRLGVTAPTTIKVHRREVYEAIQQQKMNEKTDK
jgi:carbon storage regulator